MVEGDVLAAVGRRLLATTTTTAAITSTTAQATPTFADAERVAEETHTTDSRTMLVRWHRTARPPLTAGPGPASYSPTALVLACRRTRVAQILLLLLFLTMLVAWMFRVRRYRFLHETGVSMILGVCLPSHPGLLAPPPLLLSLLLLSLLPLSLSLLLLLLSLLLLSPLLMSLLLLSLLLLSLLLLSLLLMSLLLLSLLLLPLLLL